MTRSETDALVRRALREDFGRHGDVTTKAFLPPSTKVRARIVAKQVGVVAGLSIAARVFQLGARGSRVTLLSRDGRRVRPGKAVLEVRGGPSVLSAERVALNFLQRLSGVASLTRRYVDAVRGTRAKILDTRKTTPTLRALEKAAVRAGGGVNHRMRLDDMAMIKDNHLNAVLHGDTKSVPTPELRKRVSGLRKRGIKIEIEAKNASEIELALALGADIVLLDNMPPAKLGRAVRRIRKESRKTKIEASGGITLRSVGKFASLGVDRISVGALTHSAASLDFSLDVE